MINKGDTFTQKFTISEEIYRGFIMLFNDTNPLHTDKSFAQQKGFRSEVMYGNILNGFISYFIGECLPMKNVIIHSQEIKYSNPVYLHDNLEFHAEVADVFESVNVIEFKYCFEKENKIIVAKGRIQIGVLA